MKVEDNRLLLQMHAEVCKAFAHPTRLAIINALRDQERTVTEMAEDLGVAKGNLAQHLAVLRQRQVVVTRREGVNVYYGVVDPKIIQACELMRSVLMNQLKATEKLSKRVSAA
ncbi:MAG: ArsR/SmtB family transcription factor [Thermoleophilia bacterium]